MLFYVLPHGSLPLFSFSVPVPCFFLWSSWWIFSTWFFTSVPISLEVLPVLPCLCYWHSSLFNHSEGVGGSVYKIWCSQRVTVPKCGLHSALRVQKPAFEQYKYNLYTVRRKSLNISLCLSLSDTHNIHTNKLCNMKPVNINFSYYSSFLEFPYTF